VKAHAARRASSVWRSALKHMRFFALCVLHEHTAGAAHALSPVHLARSLARACCVVVHGHPRQRSRKATREGEIKPNLLWQRIANHSRINLRPCIKGHQSGLMHGWPCVEHSSSGDSSTVGCACAHPAMPAAVCFCVPQDTSRCSCHMLSQWEANPQTQSPLF
jgi:hypothetical protein